MDKILRGGQLGGFDISSTSGNNLAGAFKQINEWVMKMYKDDTKSSSGSDAASSSKTSSGSGRRALLDGTKALEELERRAQISNEENDPCKCPKKKRQMKDPKQCDKCAADEIRTSKGTAQKQCQKCPKGQKPNQAADKCLIDCPKGKKANKAGDKCEMECPKGKELNGAGDKCESDCPASKRPDKTGKSCETICLAGKKPSKRNLDGHYRVARGLPVGSIPAVENSGDACVIDCPAGKKANPGGNKCVLDCPKGKKANTAGDKCELDCPDGQKLDKTGKSCEMICPPGKKPGKRSLHELRLLPRGLGGGSFPTVKAASGGDTCVWDCPAGKKANSAGDKCVCKNGAKNNKCDLDEDRRKKEEEERKRREKGLQDDFKKT
ncbi:MAG: hypothetical protein Q9202_003381 [Teloschistes flavicans]